MKMLNMLFGRRLVLVGVLSVVALVSTGYAAADGRKGGEEDYAMSTEFRHQGIAYRIRVTDADLEAGPSWDPEDGSPVPLSVTNVCLISKAELRRYVEDPETFRIGDIHLTRFASTKYWIYKVNYRSKAEDVARYFAGVREVQTTFHIVVLLSGKCPPVERVGSSGP